MLFPTQVCFVRAFEYLAYCFYSSIVRLSAFDLVQSLVEESESAAPYYSALIEAVNKHLKEATQNSSSHWWKVSA